MTKKTRKVIISTAAAILFIAIIYISAATVCAYKENYSNDDETGFFQKLSHSVYGGISDNTPASIFRKTVYNLTGRVSSNDVKNGKNGFLFPVKTDTFDYKKDFNGEYTYSEEELSKIADTLQNVKSFYENNGAEYCLYIIPNTQTVYDEISPFGDEISENTRSSKLIEYMNENTTVDISSLAEVINNYTDGYNLYNNTENSINSLGAYYVYDAIAQDVGKAFTPFNINHLELTKTETDGKELAERVGMKKTVKNITYTVDMSPLELKYAVVEKENGITVTTAEKDSGIKGNTKLLLQIPSENERALLKPYFAASYAEVVSAPNALACEEDGIDAVVHVIREDELDIWLDEVTSSSYGESVTNGIPTEKPQIYTALSVARGSTLVFGKAEDGAKIVGKCGGKPSETVCIDGLFIISVENSGGSDIMITAQKKGMEVSSPAYTSVPKKTVNSDNIITGSGSRLFYDQTLEDYTKENAFSDKQLSYMDRNAKHQLDDIRKLTGKETEIIILCAPNPLTVYGDSDVSDRIKNRVVEENESRKNAFAEKMSEIDGISVIDLTDVIKENEDAGKLYYQTDTHWTEIGAYFGYRSLMQKIAEKFPNAAPYDMDDFDIKYTTDIGGDLAGFIGVEERIRESVPHLVPRFESKVNESYEKPETISRPEAIDAFSLTANGDGLPSAYMVRDSYAMQMLPYTAEHFSNLYIGEMWDYGIDRDAVKELAPDYIIYVVAERNIGNLFMG